MPLQIRHTTTYTYGAPVSLSVHRFFLYPRTSPDIVPLDYHLQIDPPGKAQWLRDLQDNHYLQVFFPDKLSSLTVHLELTCALHQPNPYAYLLEARAQSWPFSLTPDEERQLSAQRQPGGPDSDLLARWWQERQYPAQGETTALLTEWTRRFPGEFHYQPRETPGTQDPAETIARKQGTCRDLAVLFSDCLRLQGLATRLVTGYLFTPADDTPEENLDRQTADAGSALHAWVEVYLPGAGWRGIDPTNGVFCDDHYLPLAVAPGLEKTHPFQGTYFSPQPVSSGIHTVLHIERTTD